MTKDKTIYEDDFFSNEDYFKPFKKDKMIYNDDNTIGVDEQSLKQFDSLFNNNVDVSKTLEANKQLLEHPFFKNHIQIIEG